MTDVIATSFRTLPVRLTEDELLALGEETGKILEQINATEESHAEAKAHMKTELLELSKKRNVLARKLARREEDRSVEVTIVATRDGMVEVIRNDTGEVIERRSMTDHDRQRILELREAKNAAPAPAGS